jgi:hypothetical protein
MDEEGFVILIILLVLAIVSICFLGGQKVCI